MREVRVYSEQALSADTTLQLGRQASRHISQVLRMQPGQSLTLFDGSGSEYGATIAAISRSAVEVVTGAEQHADRESPLKITLWHGLCRAERMDTVVQKATELGVTTIQPVLNERSIIKLDEKRAAKKTMHWRNIAISACEQSGRNVVPEVCAPESFQRLLTRMTPHDIAVLLHPSGSEQLTALVANRSPDSVLLCTGPEGGFSDAETAAAQEAGLTVTVLGPRVLRTETAPLAALSVIQALAGDLA
ncbi:MAG: 16S rRNA (uracil(1498)-N(3))-methyltransferase [Gammaproteobacteria bacterium]|nr:16S rRNA (uracil(1498)-N(3))-methyltransferase [Gammaproteobacteria bacterium]